LAVYLVTGKQGPVLVDKLNGSCRIPTAALQEAECANWQETFVCCRERLCICKRGSVTENFTPRDWREDHRGTQHGKDQCSTHRCHLRSATAAFARPVRFLACFFMAVGSLDMGAA